MVFMLPVAAASSLAASTAAATAATAAATSLSSLGTYATIASAAGDIFTGISGQKQGRAQAQALALQAEDAKALARFNIARRRREIGLDVATAKTKIAASGLDVTQGSALDIYSDIVLEGELDVALMNAEAQARVKSLGGQAASARAAGDTALLQGAFGAGKRLVPLVEERSNANN